MNPGYITGTKEATFNSWQIIVVATTNNVRNFAHETNKLSQTANNEEKKPGAVPKKKTRSKTKTH